MSVNEEKIREELKQVIDPELFVNIIDLGLVYTVTLEEADEEGKQDVAIEMTLTSPFCPAGPQLRSQTEEVTRSIEGVGDVDVKIVMEPAWTQDRMTEDAKDKLNIW